MNRPQFKDNLRIPALSEANLINAPEIDGGFNRRDFLRVAGFSLAAGTVMIGCGHAPIEKAIPYLIQPEEIIPGRAYWYASTCGACSAGCGIMVKNRDSRPVKLEGNPDHPASHGGLCAVGQASILGLYDSHRLQQPVHNSGKTSLIKSDRLIVSQLKSIREQKGTVRVLTGTITSPATKELITEFLGGFSDGRHIEYDTPSRSTILDAHERTHGARILPHYRLDKADVIVSFDADFLGTWISPVEHTSAYAPRRDVDANNSSDMSYHIQFESRLSITGSKADDRIIVLPGQIALLMNQLAERLAKMAGVSFHNDTFESESVHERMLDNLVKQLWNNRGRSLVLCGAQDVECQVLCNFINQILDSYGSTIDIISPSNQRRGNDRELERLISELEAGKVDALIVNGVNPVYDLPEGGKLAAAMKNAPLSICITERINETAAAAGAVCAESHYLESWSDSEAVDGVASIFQPVIRKFGQTRTLAEYLAAWLGEPASDYDLVRDYWHRKIHPRSRTKDGFRTFWDKTVHDGYAKLKPTGVRPGSFDYSSVRPAKVPDGPADGSYALILYPKVGMMDGRHAYNPFLQELPDPISKVTWDNYASFSSAAAHDLGLEQGDVVRISSTDGISIDIPAFIQPAQHDKVITLALGYGSLETVRFKGVNPQWLEAKSSVGDDGRVGRNVARFARFVDASLSCIRSDVTVEATGEKHLLATTQEHNFLDVREKLLPPGGHAPPIIHEGTLADFAGDPTSVVPRHKHEGDNLWPEDHKYENHHWAMVIDLNKCTGCGACVVACQIENNIPVVGKDEVRRNREMHWLRIDRYYSNNDGRVDVAFQPMFCQQCDHAPCETVCPVLATVHSSEGLNQQIYNRCVGTRYCANNCPYKVRRFNWFNYAHDDQRQNLLLNPDVTVRSRGIMEKCTFCVQRIQEAKIEAKRLGQPVADRQVQPACQQSCPAGAIVFGDDNNSDSEVAKLMESPRRYRVLEELNVRPSVGYLAVIRNRQNNNKLSDDKHDRSRHKG